MNTTVQLIIVGATIAAAVVFFAVKAVRSARGEKPSCCGSDDGGAVRSSCCDGCSGCSHG